MSEEKEDRWSAFNITVTSQTFGRGNWLVVFSSLKNRDKVEVEVSVVGKSVEVHSLRGVLPEHARLDFTDKAVEAVRNKAGL